MNQLPGVRILNPAAWTAEQLAELQDMYGDLIRAGQSVTTTFPTVAQSIPLQSQAADISATAFKNVAAPGTYRVSIDLETTTADAAAGTVTYTVAFTDDAGSTSVAVSGLSLATTGRSSSSFFIQLASGNITYAISHTGAYHTALYSLYLCLERLS